MGKLALAAKITHVPSMYLSEFPGPNLGCREAAINGHKEIDRRCRALGVDTIVVFDVHWQVNSEYHINCGPKFEGIYTSNELPHFIKNMPYAYPGNPALGHLIGDMANDDGREEPRPHRHHAGAGVRHAGAHALHERRPALQGDQHQRLVRLARPARIRPLRPGRAARHRGAATTARWRCSPAARCRTTSPTTAARRSSCTRSTTPSWSRWTAAWCELWKPGDWKTFIGMLPMYADKCWGEGDMHDTAMLLGLLGWDGYAAPVEIVTPYFGSSGTGQINAIFPVTPLATDSSGI